MSSGEPRYLLVTYACEGGIFPPNHSMGTFTFTQIFTNRPWDCRYAVMRTIAEPVHFLMVDLYDAHRRPDDGDLAWAYVPAPGSPVFDDLDSALMAARLANQ